MQDMGLGASSSSEELSFSVISTKAEEALVPQMDPDALDLGSAASILDDEVQAEGTLVPQLDLNAPELSSAASLLDYGGVVQAMGLGAEEALVTQLDPDALDLGSTASLLEQRWSLQTTDPKYNAFSDTPHAVEKEKEL